MRGLRFGLVMMMTFSSAEFTISLPARAQSIQELNALFFQAIMLDNAGKTAEATVLVERVYTALAKRRERDGEYAAVATYLARLYWRQGRYAEAERLYKDALPILERQGNRREGKEELAKTLSRLANVYRDQGRYLEAEFLHKRAHGIREQLLGPNHLDVAWSLNALGVLALMQHRYEEAERFYKRALSIREAALGTEHEEVGESVLNLAGLYMEQGRDAEAEPLFKRALVILEKELGPDHPQVGTTLHNMAGLYVNVDRYAEAEPLYMRSLAIAEKAQGPNHPKTLATLNQLAILHHVQKHYTEAELLYERALTIASKVIGPEHPLVGSTLNNLGVLHFNQGHWAEAASYWRQSTGVRIRNSREQRQLGILHRSGALGGSNEFVGLLKSFDRLVEAGAANTGGLGSEMFKTAQLALASEAAGSLAQMAARQAQGKGALAGLIRERQDLIKQRQELNEHLVVAISQAPNQRDSRAETQERTRLATVDARIAALDKRLAKDFPDYAAVVNPEPLDIVDVQALLRTNEVLLLLVPTGAWSATPRETFVWAITKTDLRRARKDFSSEGLTEGVAALRCGLDYTLWESADSAERCRTALGAAPRVETVNADGMEREVTVLPFDLRRAHELYKALLGPVEDLIRDKHLLIVPSGPLTSLPLGVLVTEARARGEGTPATAAATSLADYRNAAWLGTRQPITVLPSVASLKALRQFAKTSRASKPYLGVGNPLLEGEQGHAYAAEQAAAARGKQSCAQGAAPVQTAMARGKRSPARFTGLFRGAQANIEHVRAMSPLPETADELCEVSRRLGVPESEILLGDRAREAAIKKLSEDGRLADYRVLHFATHGALTGQVQGAAEPGLILTPPAKGTADATALERDDGYLAASEIATLKLDADWVILSACNTAGGQSENAEALSGLARAFFYAGARTLLVSHWEVGSEAAVKLTTRAFAELKADAAIGRAEAFRRSMRALIETGSAADAHPAMWAPFVVVGEGGR